METMRVYGSLMNVDWKSQNFSNQEMNPDRLGEKLILTAISQRPYFILNLHQLGQMIWSRFDLIFKPH